jgi:UDP-glucose 4-epimerase
MPDTVLVTGGAGYVGSHIVVELARAGYAPVVLDSFANSTPAILPRLEALAGRPVPSIAADVRDIAALRAAFHDHPINAVIHCAGLKAVAESEERPLAYYDVNVGGALALAEVMGEAGVATFVFSSSATVYGQPESLPVTEDAPLRPHNVYGRTKRIVEDFLRDLARANPNWRIAVLRYFNPAGAHGSAMLGESSRGRPQNLVPLLCRIGHGIGFGHPIWKHTRLLKKSLRLLGAQV